MRTRFLLSCLFAPLLLFPQDSIPVRFFKGWQHSIKGGGFQYHSPEPDVTTSLLVRSLDSAQYIEWESETVPEVFAGQSVNFIWMFGIDANPDSHTFRLFVNGSYCLSFRNPVMSEADAWRVDGDDGSSLLFKTTLLDKYNDPMGYAVFSLPASRIIKGRPQKFRIVGESKESRSWYMTFESGVEEKLTIAQVPAVLKTMEGNKIPLLFRFVRLGEPVAGEIRIPGLPGVSFSLETGFNEIKVLLPEDISPGELSASIRLEGNKPVIRNFAISLPRYFTIYLVQHTHTDIGYTRPQTEILPDHLRYIDYALDFCDLTDNLPDDARFRWTCETSWAVREYLQTRPEAQISRLRQRVKEGRIELTGLFLNSSDLADETIIAASLKPVSKFRAQGLPVKAAMQSDINGVPWCLADYLPSMGIGYLNMAQNTHRAHKPFDIPTTFWWESPSGSRIMVNRPEHYMYGNALGILGTRETFEKGLFEHLRDIVDRGYPYDHYAIQFSGYLTDNSPPSTTACRLVDEWNRVYAWPRLRLATISEFMDYMKENHPNDLPVVRGAWPDWWMDGFGSAPIETAYARKAHADYVANDGLMAMATLLEVPQNQSIRELCDQITDDLAFYDEHTFGAAESITDPLCENSVVQKNEKLSYVWSAAKKNRILREEIMGEIQPYLPLSADPTITLFNTLGQLRSGSALVYIDHQLLPKERTFSIVDDIGKPVAMQQVSTREEGTWWLMQVKDLPPLGFKTYRILAGEEPRAALAESPFSGILENDFYRLEVDRTTGRLISIYDKQWKRELTDPGSEYSTGEFIYERLGKNRAQLEQRRLEDFTRTSWHDIRVSGILNGPVWQSVTLTGQVEECAFPPGITCEIRLYNHEKKVEFLWSMKKKPVTDPEGVYIAFPFQLEHGRHVVEVAGGTMDPSTKQIEGASSDWTGIQNFVALRSDSGQIVFVSPEIPLVQLGGINLGNFSRIPHPASGNIFSWGLNNYWTTNFLASEEGELKWSYQVTSERDTSNALAARFGMENRIPVFYRVFPGSVTPDSVLFQRSFYPTSGINIILVSAHPAEDGKGILLQLREVAGRTDSLTVHDLLSSSIDLAGAMRAAAVTEVNASGDPLKSVWKREQSNNGRYRASRIWFRPFETKFILLSK